jgi:phosphoribulokinase
MLYTYHKQSINHAITFMALAHLWIVYGCYNYGFSRIYIGDSSEVALWGAQPGTLLCLDSWVF